MNVYVESNFVLELTLLQASHASCEAILHLAEVGAARLVIPAFSLIEPYETLRRRQVRRRRMKIDLDQEFGQLARTASHSSRLADFANLTSLLIDSAEEDNRRLEVLVGTGAPRFVRSVAELFPQRRCPRLR